ncbi:MAG: amidohydrolase [Sphingomonadales bacterium]|nr:MAG: amidohydrolase [Sphingomonadales bacterium]
MFELPFIDAHVHLWDLARDRYDWLSPPFGDAGPNRNTQSIARDQLLDDYLAEAANWNVAGIVHLDAGAANPLAETDWLQDMADARGMPNGIVANASLHDPSVEALLADHARRRNVRGIRHIISWHADPNRTYTPRDLTLDADWAHGFGLLAKYNLSFDLQAYPSQFAGLARIIARHPETPVIIDHTGMGVDGDESWRASMKAMAALPNVAIKISGLGFVYRPFTAAGVRDRVRETIDLFGVERCMFASNFPTDRLFADFETTLGALADAVSDFGEGDRRALFARNANRIYRLNLDV